MCVCNIGTKFPPDITSWLTGVDTGTVETGGAENKKGWDDELAIILDLGS